jgi:hypothetical protein
VHFLDYAKTRTFRPVAHAVTLYAFKQELVFILAPWVARRLVSTFGRPGTPLFLGLGSNFERARFKYELSETLKCRPICLARHQRISLA